jgi:hypothetical protein
MWNRTVNSYVSFLASSAVVAVVDRKTNDGGVVVLDATEDWNLGE